MSEDDLSCAKGLEKGRKEDVKGRGGGQKRTLVNLKSAQKEAQARMLDQLAYNLPRPISSFLSTAKSATG